MGNSEADQDGWDAQPHAKAMRTLRDGVNVHGRVEGWTGEERRVEKKAAREIGDRGRGTLEVIGDEIADIINESLRSNKFADLNFSMVATAALPSPPVGRSERRKQEKRTNPPFLCET